MRDTIDGINEKGWERAMTEIRKPYEMSDTVKRVVARCIESKTWRSECEKEVLAYVPKSTPRTARDAVKAYIREQYDAAGAGFTGRWQ